MIYYRIAWKNDYSSLWQWKSTKLTSLEGVLHFLRVHRAIPQDRLRVFSSSSYEALKEFLEEEKQGRQQISVTAEQFLRERGFYTGRIAAGASQQSESGGRENQGKKNITATLPPLVNQSSAQDAVVNEQHISMLDRRRLEREVGAGDDHDLPYSFSLPLSLPQVLAWIRLMGKVQHGELEP